MIKELLALALVAALLPACSFIEKAAQSPVAVTPCEAAAVLVAADAADKRCPNEWESCEAREEILASLDDEIARCQEAAR